MVRGQRCSGYRPQKENREEVLRLRAELGSLKSSQWQKAGSILREITVLTGHGNVGKMGGLINPRACRYCDHFGHTRQHCAKRKADEEAAMDREIRAHEAWKAERAKVEQPRQPDPVEALFNELGWASKPHPAGIGLFPAWYVDDQVRRPPRCGCCHWAHVCTEDAQ